ncbi:MAG: aldo/keto reductase [Gammaproteobacteria bacterium]|nr:aldo/keto reductase [Gammaproteobacteria bacterium]
MSTHLPPFLNRRELLQAGVAGSVVVALARLTPVLAAAARPLTKAIPSTGEQLPVIGIGTNSFRVANLASLRPLLQRFDELGATVIDTAALYGDSETAIGQVLADLGLRKQMFLATKLMGDPLPMTAPPPAPPAAPGAPAGGAPPQGAGQQLLGAASFEHSLQALQTDRVDLLQVHGMNGIEKLIPLLVDWKKAGRIRYLGATTSVLQDHPRMLECMRQYPLDFVQVDYSIANRDAAASILPLARERRMAVFANVPLGGRGGGNLVRSLTRPLPPWAAELGIGSWAQYMLKYVISHPAVTCAIPGSTKLEHLEDNQRAAVGALPDAALRQRMEQYWDQA